MAETNPKHPHGGHRARLKERFLREGLDGFEKHNMLELLLFFSIPQQDTNPIAHALLDRFGSISDVFAASFEELCTVKGVSEHTATLLKLVPAISRAALCENRDPDARYDTLNKIGNLFLHYYAGVTVETVYLLLLDNSDRMVDMVKICDGSVNRVQFDTRKLIEQALRPRVSRVVLAHNHPNGTLVPSAEDMETTTEVANAFRTVNVEMLEHLLVADGKFEPLLSKCRGIFWSRGRSRAFYDS